MAYQRKTKDIFHIYGYYETGWEYLCSESTRKEARFRCVEYWDNERIPTKIKVVREKLKQGED